MSDSSFLEYLFETHKSQLSRPSDYLALLCHAMLLDKKVKLKNGKAVLPENWNHGDIIRLLYTTEDGVDINVSVVETAGDAFVSVTESKNDHLGHLEVPIDDFVNMSQNLSLEESYPQLNELKKRFDENVWAIIFPPAKKVASKLSNPESTHNPLQPNPFRRSIPLIDNRFPGSANPFDYGRRDLDPFGIGNDPLRQGPGIGGGGMLFDPRQQNINDRSPYPGAPLGAGPPGARIDPILPFPTRPGRGTGGPPPDPDMPTPPGWEDMYL